jgi:hypothetical protein
VFPVSFAAASYAITEEKRKQNDEEDEREAVAEDIHGGRAADPITS